MLKPNYEAIVVQTPAEEPVALPTLWRDQPALLFFLRHPGCSICRQQLLLLRDHAPQFAALGVRVAVLTMAEPHAAGLLARLQQLPFPVYSDQRKQAYQAFGFLEGKVGDALGPAAMLRLGQAALAGQLIGGTHGQSLTQFGGLVLLRAGASEPAMIHVADPIYHYPPWADVLAAASRL